MAGTRPATRRTNLAADGLELTVFFWIADPDDGQAKARSDVNLAILRRLGELGADTPFPQRVLHLPCGVESPVSPGAAG